MQPTDRWRNLQTTIHRLPAANSWIILGRDFLSRNQLGITWGPEGVLQLRDKQDLLVQTAEEITNPTVKLAAKIVIPSRSLVLVTVSTTLPSCRDKTCFDFIPTQTNLI